MELLPGLHRALRRTLQLRGASSKEAKALGLPLHYYEVVKDGRGPPIVLVHGLGGSANGFYKLFFPLARTFRRVIAPDLPGNGFSSLPSGCLALSAQRQLEVLTTFLEEVVGEPAVVVGTSLGGAMCITLAHQRPDLVRALMLIAPAGARVTEERLRALVDLFEVRTNADARALTRRLFHKAPLSALLLSADLRKMYSAPAVKAVLMDVKSTDLLDPALLQSLQVPTLLLWGASEKLLPEESVDFFRAHLPRHAEVHVVPGFGHIPQVERPKEVVRHLVGFAQRVGVIGAAVDRAGM